MHAGATEADEAWMSRALAIARRVGRRGEVPVGAIVVAGDEVLGRGGNRREAARDPTAHAEVVALRQAARRRGSWRLDGCTIYVTLEPCAMCAGACVNARIARIVYGCRDPKAGYVETLGTVASDRRLNHRCRVTSGVLAGACGSVLTEFFRGRRGRPRGQG